MYKKLSCTLYQSTNDDKNVKCSCAGGAMKFTLAPKGQNIITITKTDSSANAITVYPASGETIDNGTAGTVTIATQNEYKTFAPTDTGWTLVDSGGANKTETLANKTLTSPILTTPKIADGDKGCTITSADQTHASATVTIPNFTGAAEEFVLKAQNQALTNKTLTAPVITNPAYTYTIGAHNYGGAAADWTLSASELLVPIHKPTNASGAVNAIVSQTVRSYTFINATGQALTVKTAAGTGIQIANGKTAMVLCDGTNVIRLTPDA